MGVLNEKRCKTRNKIPADYKYYENIKILFTLGYNKKFAYNFSDKKTFNLACETYFRELDNRIDRERFDKDTLEGTKCDKCNGTGIKR